MNDKNNNPSGIIITDNISLSLPKKNSFLDYIPLIFIALLGCIGTVNSFVSMFRIDISYWSLNFYILFFFVLFSILYTNQKSISLPAIPIFLVYEFLLYRKWDRYLSGFMLVCNQVYQVIYPSRGSYFRLDMSEVIPDSDIKTFFVFSIFLLTAIICCLSIVWPDFFFAFIFTFPFIEIGLYHGKTPHLIPAFILIIYWAAHLALHHSGYYRSTKRNKTGFIRKNNSFFSKPTAKFHAAGQSGIIIAVFSAAVMAISFIAVNISGYNRSQKINKMRSNVKTAVSEFTVDDIGGSLERLSASFGLGNIGPRTHRLGNLDSLSYDGKTELTVIADRNARPDGNIYLKGYVGSVYDGKSWGLLDKKTCEKAQDIFDRYVPQNMLYTNFSTNPAAFYDSQSEDGIMEFINYYADNTIRLTLKPDIFNRKYFFTPYNSSIDIPADKLDYINDTIFDSDDKNLKKKYSFDVSPVQDFSGILSEPANESSNAYYEFVLQNYLDVPNNDDTQKLYEQFIQNNLYTDDYAQLVYIKKVLAENAVYTLSPGKTPANRDFVSYFLLDNHKGYCVHFATAGILLARMSGIPARYADGYVLLQSDFNMENFKDGKYIIDIKDRQAHAWAEIYLNGYGWVPFEFTPSSAAALNQAAAPVTTAATTMASTTSTTKITSAQSTLTTSTFSPKNTETSSSAKSIKDRVQKAVSGLSPEAKLTVAGMFILIITVCLILAVHSFVTKKREKSFHTDSNSQNAVNAYNYVVKLLDFCDIKNKNMQYLEFAEFAELSDKRIFKSGAFREMTEIALEAGLSGQEINCEYAEKAIMFSRRTALSIFRKQSLFGKIYMKFIKNLC